MQCAAGDAVFRLGASTGAGFGWRDADRSKLGFEYRPSRELALHARSNHTDDPIRDPEVTIKLLAPGLARDRVSLSATSGTKEGGELTQPARTPLTGGDRGLLARFTGGLPAGSENMDP